MTMLALCPPKPNEFDNATSQVGRVARLVRDVVEVALGILGLVVDRRRHLPVAHRERREDGLDRAGGAEAVTRRALRRRHRRPLRVLFAERLLDHARLRRVAERRRRRVRVDVADVRRLDAGVVERHPHRARRVLARRIGLRHVRRVRRDAVAGELAVDLRAARTRVLELLEHEDRSRLAHHEPVARAIERTRRALRIVVAARERAHRVEAGDADLGDRRLRPAREHHVGATHADRVRGVADRHVRRRAGRALRHQRPLGAELDRHPAGAHVRDDARDRERAHAVRARARAGCRSSPGTSAGRRCRSRPTRRPAPAPSRCRCPSRSPPGAPPRGSSARSGPCGARPCGRSTASGRTPSARTRSARCTRCSSGRTG